MFERWGRMIEARHAGARVPSIIQCACVLLITGGCPICSQLLVCEAAQASDSSGTNLAHSAGDLSSAPATSARDVAGLVLQITGEWELRSPTTVSKAKRRDAIINGSVLRRISKDGMINIVLTDGSRLICPGDAGCTGTIAVRKQASLIDSWLAVAINMFVQKPGQWVDAQSRNLNPFGEKCKVNDAVVKAEGTQIDLSALFGSAEDGRYYVRIYKAANGGDGKACFGPASISVEGGKSVAVEATEHMSPGLYRVKINRSKDDPSAQEAFILVCDAQHYEKNRFLFEKAVADAREFRQDGSAETVQELLRAYLGCLDAEGRN